MGLRGLLLLVAALAGCGGGRTTLLVPTLPSEIVWAGAIFLDLGREVGATGLVRSSAGGRFDLDLPAEPLGWDEVWVVGYS